MIFNFQIIPLDVVSSVTTILAIILLRLRVLLDEESADKSWFRENYISLTAGVITYGAYLTAVVFTGEDWVPFLRNHLYDGVAPAALVALLVSRYPSARKIVTDPAPAWPVGYLILLSGAGFVIFGLVGAAAVFTTENVPAIHFGSSPHGLHLSHLSHLQYAQNTKGNILHNHYINAVIYTSLYGGFGFPYTLFADVNQEIKRIKQAPIAISLIYWWLRWGYAREIGVTVKRASQRQALEPRHQASVTQQVPRPVPPPYQQHGPSSNQAYRQQAPPPPPPDYRPNIWPDHR